MNDDKLVEFLEGRIAQFNELEALADAVTKTESPGDLGDKYRTLIERVKDAYEAVNKTDRESTKAMERNPALRKDSRVAWHNSVVSALHKASSHSRPPVNSHNMTKIRDAAFVIDTDLSWCRRDLEKKLAEVRSQQDEGKNG